MQSGKGARPSRKAARERKSRPAQSGFYLYVPMDYRYTMPQQFIEDANVALKWKLYAYLNGFWIAGKTFYARNDTLAKHFKKSERAIQSALAELEELGLITRDIKGLSRYILPGGITEGRSPASPTHEAQLHQGGEAQLHHISDSISDSKKDSSFSSEKKEIGVPQPRFAGEDEPEPKKPMVGKKASGDEVRAIWNRYPTFKATKQKGRPNNPSVADVLLPTAPDTEDIRAAILRKRNRYSLDEIERAIKAYATELINLPKSSNGWHAKRYTLYQFLTYKTIFQDYANR